MELSNSPDARRLGSDWMRFLWSDETHFNRLLTYRLAALVEQCNALERLVLIESIEETGNVLFGLMTKLAEQYQAHTGVELRYCGNFHFGLESGHTVGLDHRWMASMELLAYAQAHPLAPMAQAQVMAG
jgi:hypothetical protein